MDLFTSEVVPGPSHCTNEAGNECMQRCNVHYSLYVKNLGVIEEENN